MSVRVQPVGDDGTPTKGTPSKGSRASVPEDEAPAAPPVGMLLEPLAPSMDQALSERYETLGKQMDDQHDVLQRLMESQRAIEDKQAKSLADDRKAMQERFQLLEKKLDEQVSLVVSVQQQQNHIIKLINVQDKLADQDRQLRMFFDYQQNFLSTLHSPMTVQAEVFQALQSNQARMLQSLGSINLPMPAELPDFSMSYAIPSALGQLPPAPERRKGTVAPPDPTTKYTNVPPLLGGMKPFQYFDADEDAKHLRKAMKGFGTDERTLVTILGQRTNAQRQQIAQAYKTNYKRDLLPDLKSETSGNFASLLVSLIQTPDVFDAHCLHAAMRGLGTNDNALIDVVCSRTPAQLRAIKAAYKSEFQRELEGDVIGDTSGDYQNLLIALLRCTRDESNTVDMLRAKEDATSLYNAGEAKVGTNEQVFITILTQRNYAHLRAVTDAYTKLEDYELERSIARETSFNFRKALIAIIKVARSPPKYHAEQLHTAMYGVGTNNNALTRTIVSRSEIDLKDIEAAYKAEYKQALVQKIRSETGGDFRALLLELFGDEGFNAEVDAKRLRQALRGWRGVDDAISKILSARTNVQRLAIVEAYTSLYKRDLVKDIEAKTTGDLRDLVLALLQPLDEFLAREVLRTVKGLGTDDNSLIEILCTRTGFQMRTLRGVYARVFGRDMATDVRGDTSGDYQRLLHTLITYERDDAEKVDVKAGLDEATRLFRAGEDKAGTDTGVVIEVLSRHSLPQLAVIFEQYNKLCDYDIEKSISRETSYNFKKALLAIIGAVRDPAQYYARRLFTTMDGVGTQDRNLIRIIVERSEVDLRSINEAFFKTYKKTLETTIRGDTSGGYRKLLLRLLDRARMTNPPAPPVTPAAAAVAAIAVAAAPAPSAMGAVVPVLTSGKDEAERERLRREADAKAEKERKERKEWEQQQRARGHGGAAAGPAPAAGAGDVRIRTGSQSITITPGRHGESIVSVDNDGDGRPDVVMHAPGSRAGGSAVNLSVVGDTHF